MKFIERQQRHQCMRAEQMAENGYYTDVFDLIVWNYLGEGTLPNTLDTIPANTIEDTMEIVSRFTCGDKDHRKIIKGVCRKIIDPDCKNNEEIIKTLFRRVESRLDNVFYKNKTINQSQYDQYKKKLQELGEEVLVESREKPTQ